MLNEELILGLDLGVNSLGWALLKCDSKSKDIVGLIDAGSRVFEAGMKGDISTGKASTKCAERRDARSIRKNIARHRQRMNKLKNLLQNFELLPKGKNIEQIILKVDIQARDFFNTIPTNIKPEQEILAHTSVYYLRALASEMELPPFLLGRAIYHLAQRRGFWSNRKSQTEEKELGTVKEGISELNELMKANKAETLGQYFAFVNPMQTKIRGLWTSRKMYKNEFGLIVKKNSALLNDKQVKLLEKAIFFQRKLKSQKSLIGMCTLETNKRRCSKYRREFQEFKYLQSINNLSLITYDGEQRFLSSDERNTLQQILSGVTEQLDKNCNLSLAKTKKLLGLHKKTKFSIESGGEKTLKGDKTSGRIIRIIGVKKWLNLSNSEQEKLIHDLHSFEKVEPLAKRLAKTYNISDENAELLTLVTLDSDYANLSLKAIKKILPKLREGVVYSEVVKEVYPNAFLSDGVIKDFLPQLSHYTENLRNPIVQRCLSEVRQVTNAIIQKYGKPGTIRVELARDVKNSKKVKERITQRNRDIEKERKKVLNKIQEEFPGLSVSRNDETKVLLAEECGYKCPYTNKPISLSSLLGPNPSFDIEHIIPRSRSLDNSFLNKTLCYHEENRNVKKNKTPYETYHGTEKYDKILDRVSKFNGNLKYRKLELFKMTPEEVQAKYEDFSNRQLNDTRYASKEAAAYLGLLYGGVIGTDGKRRVNVLSGGLTAMVRSFYGLNGILNDGNIKSRNDHRHHSVDAIAIGVTSAGMVKRLADSVRIQEEQGTATNYHPGKFKEMKSWPNLLEDSRQIISDILVSHHVSKKIRGALHEETFYPKNHEHLVKNKPQNYRHMPVELPNLQEKQIDMIVDDGIKRLIQERLNLLQIKDPKKAFRNFENIPELISKDGEVRIPIRKVRIKRKQNTVSIGDSNSTRNVVTGNNHHMLIYAILDKDGNDVKWEGEVVSLLEASDRLRNREPVVNRNVGRGKRFVMSVKCGDIFEMDIKGQRELVITRTVPKTKQLNFARVNDARLKKDMLKTSSWFSKIPNSLRTSNPIKFSITPLGELRRAND